MKRRNSINITEIEEDYLPIYDIFTEEDGVTYRLKWIIKNSLSETDRRIILMYSELQSQRKLAELLGVSTSTVNIAINRIKRQIIDELDNSN